MGGGRIVFEDWNFEAVAARRALRLSSFGRNLRGVWRTEGADDGGLKMMWSCRGEFSERRKDESGLMLSRCFERRYEDCCRRELALSESRHGLLPDRRSRTGLLISRESIVAGVDEKEPARDIEIVRAFARCL